MNDIIFVPQVTSYHSHNAYFMAKWAKLAYKEKHEIEPLTQVWGFNKFHFINQKNTDTQLFIMGNSQSIIISFRGTTNLRDWLTNLQVLKIKALDGDVHDGFYDAVNSIWEEVVDKINEFRDCEQSIFFTGHSLGAALTTITAAKLLAEKNILAQSIYTFGSPRLGDQEFVDNFNRNFGDRSFRLVNNNDIVTRVPRRLFGYAHIDKCYYIDAEGVVQDNIQLWERFLENVLGEIDDLFEPGLDFIKDHSMDLYSELMFKNMR